MWRRDMRRSARGCRQRSINANQTSSWGEKYSVLPSGGGGTLIQRRGWGGKKHLADSGNIWFHLGATERKLRRHGSSGFIYWIICWLDDDFPSTAAPRPLILEWRFELATS